MDEHYELINVLKGPIEKFEDLKGRVLSDINITDDEVHFYLTKNHYVRLYHDQSCCESVYVESVVGDIEDIVGEVLEMVEESSNSDDPPVEGADASYTWTFYRLRTRKGSLDIRFFGSSNGYYSESVSIEVVGGRLQ